MKIVVVLPMYNEETNAPLILEEIRKVKEKEKFNLKVVAVNDGSFDDTLNVLNSLKSKYDFLMVESHEKNKGVAQAIKTGIESALKKEGDILFFMDSDLTHNPNDFIKFVNKINEGYDLVIGSRFIVGGGMEGVPLIRVLISRFGNLFGGLVLKIPVRDFTSGFRCLKKEVFEKVKLEENGFPIQLEETIKTYVSGFKIGEVPIILKTRKFGKSNMVYNCKLFITYLKLLFKSLSWLKNGS